MLIVGVPVHAITLGYAVIDADAKSFTVPSLKYIKMFRVYEREYDGFIIFKIVN